jgi:uncharacterized protein (DUF486 family)
VTAAHLWPPLLLLGSNVLMTFAWYGHLKRPAWPLWLAILVSWSLAFLEYCLAVPANRIGYLAGAYSGQQLKVMQEVIALSVFAAFSVWVLHEPLRWNYLAAMACLVAAVAFMVLPAR